MGNVALPTTLWQDSCRERPFRAWKVRVCCGRRRLGFTLSLAQMERELLVERTRAGLAAVKKLGRVGGRKRLMTNSKIQSGKTLLDNGVPPREVARNLGVSIPTLYRWLPASEHS
jgi:DNA invertase Pin-like site-specific DNA recombinase